MSSDLQTVVEALQFNNYISLVIATALIYDYVITFPKEILYVWNRPWTFVSAMFLLVRYVGLFSALMNGFYGSAFIPGPTLVSTALLIASVWAFIIFLAAADIVMILRVYAMYNRSKVALGVLLVLYAATIVLYAISGEYYNNPNTYLSMTDPRVLDMSFCNPVYTYSQSSKLGNLKLIPRLTLAALLVILAVARLCFESFQSYKAVKEWKVNYYLRLLVREGIVYFLVHLLYIIDFGQTFPGVIITVIALISLYALSPRFIMNVREMHLRNIRGPDMGIDTGFGLSSKYSRSPPVSSVAFTYSVAPGITEGDIEMQMAGEER